MKIGKMVVASTLCLSATWVHALRPNEMSIGERQALPPWCEFTQSFDRAPRDPGHYNDHVARYGHGWTHLHHYCWALASIIRYSRFDLSAQEKAHLANTAIDDIDYVLRNAPDDFVLRFDIAVRKARLLMMMGEHEKARQLSYEILTRWPERADSHGLVAEVLLSLDRREEARKVLVAAESQVKDKARLEQIRSVLKL